MPNETDRTQRASASPAQHRVSRRDFLRLAGIAGVGAVVAACGAAAPTAAPASPVVVKETVPPVVVKETVVVQATAAPTQPAPTAAPAPRTKAKIRISYPDELGKKPKYVDDATQKFNAAHNDAEAVVDLQKIPSNDFYTKLLLAIGAGDAPDVFHVGGTSLAELADANFIVPLDDFVGKWDDWKFYPDAIKTGVTYKGKKWTIPYGLDTRFLYYRKDVFSQAGLEPEWQPKKMADIVTAAEAVKAKAPKVIPYVTYAGPAGAGGTSSHSFLPILWSYGGDVINADGKWIGFGAALQKTFAYLKDVFVTRKLVPAEVLTLPKPWTTMREKVGKGELAMLFEGGWVRGSWLSFASEADLTKNVGTDLFPKDDGSGEFTVGGLGTCWYISNQSKSKQAAWDWIATWNNKDTVAKLNIEDPHPVARTDSAEVAEFKAIPYLVLSTQSLQKAKFEPISADWGKVQTRIQQLTGRVANGEISPEDALKKYGDDLKIVVGDGNVVTG